MAELQPPEGQINGGAEALVVAPTDKVAPKRQRRPSVRLGDIGDPQYDLHLNRRSKQWKMPMKDSGKPSKSRGAMNFAGAGNYQDGEDKDFQLDSKAALRNWKARRGSMNRVTTSWMSKLEGEEKFSGGEDVDGGYRDFEFEGSESPLKEQSPLNSMDYNNAAGFDGDRGNYIGGRSRFSEGPSDTDGRNSERNGVREWLNQLGLGRYAPVFEIHEVDDEVLPMLTLEDLKDMGINAVGSRRKMYSSIQKLAKAFS